METDVVSYFRFLQNLVLRSGGARGGIAKRLTHALKDLVAECSNATPREFKYFLSLSNMSHKICLRAFFSRQFLFGCKSMM